MQSLCNWIFLKICTCFYTLLFDFYPWAFLFMFLKISFLFAYFLNSYSLFCINLLAPFYGCWSLIMSPLLDLNLPSFRPSDSIFCRPSGKIHLNSFLLLASLFGVTSPLSWAHNSLVGSSLYFWKAVVLGFSKTFSAFLEVQ